MTTHTPGPWKAEQRGDDWGVWVAHHRVLSIRQGVIPSAADARLIAAAPELLKALEEMMYYDDGGYRGDKARAAIAKACGVES